MGSTDETDEESHHRASRRSMLCKVHLYAALESVPSVAIGPIRAPTLKAAHTRRTVPRGFEVADAKLLGFPIQNAAGACRTAVTCQLAVKRLPLSIDIVCKSGFPLHSNGGAKCRTRMLVAFALRSVVLCSCPRRHGDSAMSIALGCRTLTSAAQRSRAGEVASAAQRPPRTGLRTSRTTGTRTCSSGRETGRLRPTTPMSAR